MRDLNYPATAADWLLPGVAFNLRRFGATDLELFLFGGARVDLSAARGALQVIQDNRCFYCESKLKEDPHVDHFIPWSRYPRDLALDDQPAALQVARWAYGQAEAASAQLWVSLKYTVNADGHCLEILGG